MANTISITSFDPSLLVNLFQAQLATTAAQATPSQAQSASATPSATSKDAPPWQTFATPQQEVQDAKILSTTNFFDTSNVPLTTTGTTDSKTEQDNQKLFSLYNALNSLTYLTRMSQRDTVTDGQRQGFNTRFQDGLQQLKNFLATTTFNNFSLQMGSPSSSTTSTAGVPFPAFDYTGATVANDSNVSLSVPGVSTSDSFNISVTKGGTTTVVPIALSGVGGTLSLDNIIKYVNQQLSAAGFSSRFARTFTSGSINDPTKATYGIAVTSAPGENLSLSSTSASAALYLVGNTGSPISTVATSGSTTSTTAPDQQGRVVKLTNLGTTVTSQFSNTMSPATGNTTAQASVVDANGNLYVVGNATGNLGNEINQGTQDVYLSKYDSAGNLLWQQLVGSSGSASGYSLALNPKGGVVIAGSTSADLTKTAIADGNTDSFVAQYDANGNQTWLTQLQTLSTNHAAAVSVDASGNVYIGGQVSGSIGAGQTQLGSTDAYLAKLDSTGKVVYEKQSGTAGPDTIAATATQSDGSLVVASVENGDAFVTKYANGDATSAPVWRMDLGSLNGGSIGGIAISGNQIYLSGATSNGNLTAGGQAAIANASSGGSDAFVFNLTDNGASASTNHISYVGTSGNEQAGGVTVGADGTVYLVGTTTGTFAGQTRSVTGANNMFAAALSASGTLDWTRQYGGADGQSTGQGIAVDASGSSVLDALGLPRGTISSNQSVDLSANTTLRAGDSFSIQIQGAATRTATIVIDQGETVDSLVTKINGELVNAGKASVSFGASTEGLKIQVSAGFTATLIAGPTGWDALARLGITAGTLTSAGASNSSSSSSTTTSSATSSTHQPQLFGLGINASLDITTAIDAGGARAQLMNALQAVQSAYQKTNAPPASTTPQATGPVPAYLQAQIANFNLALSIMPSPLSLTTTTTSPGDITSLFA